MPLRYQAQTDSFSDAGLYFIQKFHIYLIYLSYSKLFQNNISLMLQLKINLLAASHHIQKRVKCNNSQYDLLFPLQNVRYLDILKDIIIQPEKQSLIQLLSKKTDTVESFEEFYKLQQDANNFFNRTISLDFENLSFRFLSETDIILTELDKCKFNDLLAIIRKAYDSFSEKLHSKFNRRIKKYLNLSSRTQAQIQQIKKLVDLIKAESTEQEGEEKSEPKKQIEVKKQAKKYMKKQAEKESEIPKKAAKTEDIEQDVLKKQKKTGYKIKQQDNGDNDSDIKQSKIKAKPKQVQLTETHQIKHQNKYKGHKKQDNEEDWQDVKQEKFSKRKQKNNKRKHDKLDIQGEKRQASPLNDSYEEEHEAPKQKYIKNQNKNFHSSQNRNRGDSKRQFDKSREKPKKDLRVLLGLNGDSEDGWRERYRIERIPARIIQVNEEKKTKWRAKDEEKKPSEKKQNIFPTKQQKTQRFQKKEASSQLTERQQQAPRLIKLSSQGSLQKIFSFPKDGKKFKLDQSKQYRIRVNNSFWIMLQKNHMKIEKDKSGYIRQGKYKSSQEYLLEAQDLTIALDGLCNLQDGGTPFGDPKISNFTGGQSQWFHIKELQVYTYV